jgi:hypothetical protein
MTYNINFLRRTKIEISDALHTLCPGATWSVEDTYESIQNYFSEDYPLPTKEKVITEIERLQKISDDFKYQRLRATEYPSFAEQFDLLYHGGYDAWKTEIDKVKQKYPKP